MVERGGVLGWWGAWVGGGCNCRSTPVSTVQLNDERSGTSAAVFMISGEGKLNASVCFRSIYSGPLVMPSFVFPLFPSTNFSFLGGHFNGRKRQSGVGLVRNLLEVRAKGTGDPLALFYIRHIGCCGERQPCRWLSC